MSATIQTSPIVMPRLPKRAPRVTAGSAIHGSAGLACPPVSATLTAIISGEMPHDTAAHRSG